VDLPDYNPRLVNNPARIAWLPDGGLLFAQPGALLDPYKAAFLTFDTRDGSFRRLAVSEDTLFDWAYQDGWLIYSSESGVWAHNMNLDLQSPPVRLSSGKVSSLDIK